MKKRKKLIIIIGVIAVVVVVALLVLNNAGKQVADANATVQTKALQKVTLADTVDITGTVQSSNNSKVYSPVATLMVKTVNVSVGDKVNAGDVLCQLNTDSLEKQIEQSKATLDIAKSTGQSSVKTNQMKYDNDVKNLQSGQNTTINQANATVDSAKYALDQALINYNAAHAAFLAVSPGDATYDSLKQKDDTTNSAASSASKAYDNAMLAQKAAVNAVNQQIETERQALNSSKAAANTGAQEAALESLQLQLSQATITAPISGTVTDVNAVEGASSSGLLFTIDDTSGLEVATTIKEYDVNNVKLGMNCSIQSDGTGDDVYQGTLKSIEPAAVQAQTTTSLTGTTQAGSANDIKFNAIVDVTSKDTRLKIGMNARISIILSQKENVLAVPYDAVVTNAAGEKVVYAMSKDSKGNNSYQEIPVITGMETDFYIEVSGKSLQEGMQIVSNPDSIPTLKLKRALASASASALASASASASASATGSK
ncbi:MAG: efflux RND transporter periplasmic adaptor subunit [Eubacteriales bacterium]